MNSILIIDDDRPFTEILSAILNDAGLEVHAFDDPMGALRIVKRDRLRFDLALVDQRMPFCPGPELIRRLGRADPTLAGIMVTAYAAPGAYEEFRDGFFDYLAKPFRNEDLLFRVFRGLFGRILRQEGREVEVLPIDQFPAPLPPFAKETSKRSVERCSHILLTGKRGESWTALPEESRRIALCHEDFLSKEGRRHLESVLEETSSRNRLLPIACPSWKEMRAAVAARAGKGIP